MNTIMRIIKILILIMCSMRALIKTLRNNLILNKSKNYKYNVNKTSLKGYENNFFYLALKSDAYL